VKIRKNKIREIKFNSLKVISTEEKALTNVLNVNIFSRVQLPGEQI